MRNPESCLANTRRRGGWSHSSARTTTPPFAPELDPRLSASREGGNCCRHQALWECRARTPAAEAFGLIKAERKIGDIAYGSAHQSCWRTGYILSSP